jgi:hypothetical protein
MVLIVPILDILCCSLLKFSRPTATSWRLLTWLALCLIIYFSYGRHHNVLTRVVNGISGVIGAGTKAEVDIEPVAGGYGTTLANCTVMVIRQVEISIEKEIHMKAIVRQPVWWFALFSKTTIWAVVTCSVLAFLSAHTLALQGKAGNAGKGNSCDDLIKDCKDPVKFISKDNGCYTFACEYGKKDQRIIHTNDQKNIKTLLEREEKEQGQSPQDGELSPPSSTSGAQQEQ